MLTLSQAQRKVAHAWPCDSLQCGVNAQFDQLHGMQPQKLFVPVVFRAWQGLGTVGHADAAAGETANADPLREQLDSGYVHHDMCSSAVSCHVAGMS